MTDTAHPLAPVNLPEFGHAVSWAMCRNPRRENFCIHYEGPAPAGDGGVAVLRCNPGGVALAG